MKKEDLQIGKEYIHAIAIYKVTKNMTKISYRRDRVVFIEIVEHPSFWSAKFKGENGKTFEIAGWAVEQNITIK